MVDLEQNDYELLFVPLGGAEEIGMNFNLYGYGEPNNHDWLIVDLGIAFGDDTSPGVDVILPDPSFIVERKDKLLGIVLTHGHEDHIGAVPYLWNQLGCPIYATPFTAALLRSKLEYNQEKKNIEIVEIPIKGKFDLGPFSIELVTLTHSMPEPNACILRSPLGNIFHTGDWKFDPDPVLGQPSDFDALRSIGKEGVLAAIGDSTNVFVTEHSGSEAKIFDNLSTMIAGCKGYVAVACFASNVARLKTIFKAAEYNGRAVCLVGRSLWRIDSAARETGYLSDLPPFLEADETEDIPKDQILYICTGSQGERRASLARIAAGEHRFVKFGSGDTIIFSSRIIPGNELAIARLQNKFVEQKVSIINDKSGDIHVSGHPPQPDLELMYDIIRPQIVIPVHGEMRHLKQHSEIAKNCQVAETLIVKNGSIVRLAPNKASVVENVQVAKYAVDGSDIVPVNSNVIQDRRRIMYNGAAIMTVVIDNTGLVLKKPQLTTYGLVEIDRLNYFLDDLVGEIEDTLIEYQPEEFADDVKVCEAIRIIVRRKLREKYGKRPLTSVHLVRQETIN